MVILTLSVLIAVADQAVKYIVNQKLVLGVEQVIFPGVLNLKYVRNTGAAWGMLAGLNGWLVILSFLMLLVLIVFRKQLIQNLTLVKVALGFMVGGIIGNLVDRVRLGYVVDYLDFHWGLHHFPAFNIADSAICIGVGLYIAAHFLYMSRGGVNE